MKRRNLSGEPDAWGEGHAGFHAQGCHAYPLNVGQACGPQHADPSGGAQHDVLALQCVQQSDSLNGVERSVAQIQNDGR